MPHAPQDFTDVCESTRTLASELRVSPRIHAADYIFHWILNDPALPNKCAALREYLEGGARTASLVGKLIEQHRSIEDPFSMLEFASGYGRVTRHWRNVVLAADVLACDIHQQAVEFLRDLGFRAAISSSTPERLALDCKFDVVFALSFFTHMPRTTWARWLRSLVRHLTRGGLFIFTTHGMASLKPMGVKALDPDGFWFGNFSEQQDLSAEEYGATATSFEFVFRELVRSDLELLSFREAGMGYQDLYVATPRRNVA